MGFLIDRLKLNKLWLWSAANLCVGACGLIVAYSDDSNSVMVLGAMIGKCLLFSISLFNNSFLL